MRYSFVPWIVGSLAAKASVLIRTTLLLTSGFAPQIKSASARSLKVSKTGAISSARRTSAVAASMPKARAAVWTWAISRTEAAELTAMFAAIHKSSRL